MPHVEESMASATLSSPGGDAGQARDRAEMGLRPWGSYTVLEEGRGYKIKRIEVKPGHRLSLQLHHHRSEHWIVVSGTAKVTCSDQEILLSTNQSTYVPPCTRHRLENVGVIPLVLIEVQNGEYLGEDDIVRFHDDYARADDKAE
jgi:mannose-6-phosphate isomerase